MPPAPPAPAVRSRGDGTQEDSTPARMVLRIIARRLFLIRFQARLSVLAEQALTNRMIVPN